MDRVARHQGALQLPTWTSQSQEGLHHGPHAAAGGANACYGRWRLQLSQSGRNVALAEASSHTSSRRGAHINMLVEMYCLFLSSAFNKKIADDKMMLKRSSAHQGRGQPATGGRAGQQGVASPGKLLISYAT